MGPHSLASKVQIAVSSPFKDPRSRRVSPCFRETGIRASEIRIDQQQSVRGVNYRDLRLFVDSAKSEDLGQFLPSGIFYGVTTNPFLLKEAQVSCKIDSLKACADRAIKQGATEVHLQTWGRNASEMFQNGWELANNGGNHIVVKVPITEDGLKAAKLLVKKQVRVTMTGLFSVHQILLAIGVGAVYAAPYLGRMDAAGKQGMHDIQKMQTIINALKSDTRLLVASINHVAQVADLAACGVNSFAIKEDLIKQLLQDPHTDKVAREFEEAVSENTETTSLELDRKSTTVVYIPVDRVEFDLVKQQPKPFSAK